MKIVAMNCPNCGGKLTLDDADGKLICESCNSLLHIEDDDHSPKEKLNFVQQAREKELQKMLERYKLIITNYKARGVIDPVEVEGINKRYLKSILAISPRNASARLLQNYLSSIERTTINGILMDLTLEKSGIFSITKKSDGDIIYSKPLEQVTILKFQEPRLILPGKVVFGNLNDMPGKIITFIYFENKKYEIREFINYISRVAQVPKPAQQKP